MTATEIVRHTVQADRADEFAEVIGTATEVILRHPECHSAVVYRGIEDPNTFQMVIVWTSVDAHMDWRNSDAVQEFRGYIADKLAGPSDMSHYESIVELP